MHPFSYFYDVYQTQNMIFCIFLKYLSDFQYVKKN